MPLNSAPRYRLPWPISSRHRTIGHGSPDDLANGASPAVPSQVATKAEPSRNRVLRHDASPRGFRVEIASMNNRTRCFVRRYDRFPSLGKSVKEQIGDRQRSTYRRSALTARPRIPDRPARKSHSVITLLSLTPTMPPYCRKKLLQQLQVLDCRCSSGIACRYVSQIFSPVGVDEVNSIAVFDQLGELGLRD